MSGCQHCGQGAISRDVNGPVCPDCWDEGYYETANHMTDKTETPERIWLEDLEEDPKGMVGYAWGNPVNGLLEPYTRADLSDAKDKRCDELEAERDHWKDVAVREGVCMTCRGPQRAPDTYGCTDCLNTGYCGEHHNTVAELEAKLAKATDGLRECEEEIDGYIRQEYPHDHPVQARYRARDFAANPARTTLAQIKGGMS